MVFSPTVCEGKKTYSSSCVASNPSTSPVGLGWLVTKQFDGSILTLWAIDDGIQSNCLWGKENLFEQLCCKQPKHKPCWAWVACNKAILWVNLDTVSHWWWYSVQLFVRERKPIQAAVLQATQAQWACVACKAAVRKPVLVVRGACSWGQTISLTRCVASACQYWHCCKDVLMVLSGAFWQGEQLFV